MISSILVSICPFNRIDAHESESSDDDSLGQTPFNRSEKSNELKEDDQAFPAPSLKIFKVNLIYKLNHYNFENSHYTVQYFVKSISYKSTQLAKTTFYSNSYQNLL
jgi:hypothetical protein